MHSTTAGITGDGQEAIQRTIEIERKPIVSDTEWEEIFEVERCISWIKDNSFKKVCLQVPTEYLDYSPRILEKLEKETGARCYILADSTYGSCCVDEKTATHVPDGEGIIHFGQSCLTPCSRFKVLYIFTKPVVQLDKMEDLFKHTFQGNDMDKVIIAYDVIYQHAAEFLFHRLSSSSVKITSLIIPGEEDKAVDPSSSGFIKHGRFFPIPLEEMKDWTIFYIGSRALPNLLLSLPSSTFKVYDPSLPSSSSIGTQTAMIDKLIRKRNFYVEKIKDATSIGILVGTLVVQNYLEVIERLKSIFRKVHKKFYVVSIGEINPYKLGNFMDIDCFVFVGCPEVVNYYISDESKGQFFQAIVTPYDVELAFCSDTQSYGKYVIDWAYLVAKGEPNVKELEEDVSLITGGLRSLSNYNETTKKDNQDQTSANQVVNWLGLDVNEDSPSGENTSQIHPGRSGIASFYSDEPMTKK